VFKAGFADTRFMTRLRLPLVCTLAAGALLVGAAPASAIRYAAPTAAGSGNCTSVANACTVSNAVEGGGGVPIPPSGEEIVVLPGEHVLPDSLSVDGTLNVHGLDGSPRPTLRLTGASAQATVITSLTSPGTLRHLRIHGDNNSGGVGTVNASGVAIYSDLEVLATGATQFGFTARNGAVLRDSTVRVDYQFGIGVPAQQSLANKLVNVTVVATGTDSIGVSVYDFGNGTNQSWKVTVVNSIIDGGLSDLRAAASNVGDDISIDVRNSNWAVAATVAPGTVNDLGGNQTTAPLFASFAAGDFHELLGSPTIDAGTADPQLGSTDFDGQARTIGAAPDIGADEFQPATTGGGSDTPPPTTDPADPAPRCEHVQRGTRRADRLFGTGAGDFLIGGRGNDLLRGRAGDDCLRGELGRDRLEGSDGDDTLLGGPDADTLVGGAGTDRMNGGDGSDNLAGSRGADVLAGDSGPDRLAGDGGVDVHRAGQGNDFVSAADGHREIVDCGAGRDRARVDRNDRVIGCERVVRVG
jgi:Ca2+-binding RTX toxin-like protein